MSNTADRNDLINKAAVDVMTLARSTLIVRFRFLDIAISRLQISPDDSVTLATDGNRLIYGPRYVLTNFRSDRDRPPRDYMHVLLHCLFSHMFIGADVDSRLWNLACDIAAECTANDLGLAAGASRKAAQAAEADRLRSEVKMLTAERIYHYYKTADLPDFEIERLSRIFAADDHSGWYSNQPEAAPDTGAGEAGTENNRNLPDIEGRDTDEPVTTEGTSELPLEELMEEWQKIAGRVREDLETFSRERGDAAGTLVQNLRAVTREKYDYTEFLRKFSVYAENMKVNDEEFDYIFYMYGLELYDNMPLVEPLEYKEEKRIRDFVIAVDTSASTSGNLVQSFIRKTYNILKSTESFFSRINVHIIQCDADIQEHVKITSVKDFDNYISTMVIRGQGGTDFRPVFRLVDSLIENGELTDPKGLIYFTDGRGAYPVRKPGYETAFVFLDNEYDEPEVPPWAIRIVLHDDDLQA